MLSIILILCFYTTSNLFDSVNSIQCFTCTQHNHHCQLPLAFDTGDESNENDIEFFNYNSDYYCQSDQSMDPASGFQKIILRGVQFCEEIDIPNRRVHCCRTDHCNKHLPDMQSQSLADLFSSGEQLEFNKQTCVLLSIISILLPFFIINPLH